MNSAIDMLVEKDSRLPGMPELAKVYLVHAAVFESALRVPESDPSVLQKLVHRRLNRLERVVASQGGKVVRQLASGLLAAFHTADAAVFGACEMQRRCAVIPQISDTQLALKIGIQSAEKMPISDGDVDPAEIVAIKLASVIGESSIVVADCVVDGLAAVLRKAASPIADASLEVAAMSIDWQRVPMARLPKASKQVAEQKGVKETVPVSIVLRQGDRLFNFGSNHPVITLGRDTKNNITVSDVEASRQHCKIIYQRDGYVLVDVSTNGTFLVTQGHQERRIKRAMIGMPKQGHISLGHSFRASDPSTLAFEISGGDS